MNAISATDIQRLQASASRAAGLLKALSNPHRLLILCQLEGGEVQASHLGQGSGLSQSALSQHLARLRDDGLVATRRQGAAIFYRIADPAALKVIGVLVEIYCPPAP